MSRRVALPPSRLRRYGEPRRSSSKPRPSGGGKGCATSAVVAARIAARVLVAQPFRVACTALILALVSACGAPPPIDHATTFTPAHRTTGEAFSHFFNTHPTPVQPIAFPHKTHIAKQAVCTDCHESVEKGPIAGIPSVKTCMICHSQIATDRPLIKEVTAYSEKGVEIPWKRVYGFPHEAHVRFNHAPHIRASVDCKTCHGDVGNQTVAERSVDHNMGFCVNCHREKKAPNDCLTCHY